jgi:hypothetical protein
VPTLVEVKRSSDTRIRRRVVGQMLDYAANAVRYGDIHEIRRSFLEQTVGDGKSEEGVLEDALGVSDPDAFWDRVEGKLDRGEIRMVFVADRIPPELRRIVEFLNEQVRPAEVLAVEVKQYAGEGLRTLVPRVHGKTAAAEQTKGREKPPWDADSFFDEIEAQTSANTRRLARRIYDWSREQGFRVTWSPGASAGGFFVGAGDQKLFKVTVGGRFWTRCAYYDAVVAEGDWGDLQEKLASLGLTVPDDRTSAREPQATLPAGHHDPWFDAFVDAYTWILCEHVR